MGSSSRRRGSRAGLVLFVVVLLLLMLEVVGRIEPALVRPPSRFVAAVWTVAHGGTVGEGDAGAGDAGAGGAASAASRPTAEQLAKNAYRPLPYVMYGLKPSWERVRENDRVPLRTSNSLGFRGPEIEIPKPAGRYRIVCLGGSTTYDDSVSDADAYPAQLQRMLRVDLPGRDIEVVNAGVPSYTSAESLTNLIFRCLELSPDALLIFDNINDRRPRTYKNFDNAYFHYRKVWNGTADTWETGAEEMQGGINPFIQHNLPPQNGDGETNLKAAGTWAFRRNLTCMAAIAKAYGIRAHFVSFMMDEAHEYATPGVIASVREQNDVLRQVAQAHGGNYLDLAAKYPKGAYWHDPVHNNAEGARVKARIIADELVKELR